MTNKQFDRDNRRWVFERRNSKGKKYNRVQYLSVTAFVLTAKWAMRYPEGPIFRNQDGNPWTAHALQSCATALGQAYRLSLDALLDSSHVFYGGSGQRRRCRRVQSWADTET